MKRHIQRKRTAASICNETIGVWKLKRIAAAVVAGLVAGGMQDAYGLPQGAELVAGSATVQQTSSQRMDINQQSQRGIINWREFGINSNEQVNITQPSASAVLLNRVVGGGASLIDGRLTANGGVYLINQNGIIFGKDANVNVASLVATTANLSNDDFMAGRLKFTEPGKPGATVENHGKITIADAGLAAFVAPEVRNTGVIIGRLGKVALAAGDAFSLDLYGDKLINLVLDKSALSRLTDANGNPLSYYVDQSGVIEADGGYVQLEAAAVKDVINGLINMSGVTVARSASENGGVISVLGGPAGNVNISGSVDASSTTGQGGHVEVTGESVKLASTARVDASGGVGGGNIYLGGDFQGKGSLQNAKYLTVDAGAKIEASAEDMGEGGSVVLWSDGRTSFQGDIAATGGLTGGNGGNVEVSGKDHLNFQGLVDISAPAGIAGNLLLDPRYIVVDSSTDPVNSSADATTDDLIGASVLESLLQAGTNVTLTASNSIFINASIYGTGGASGGGIDLTATTGQVVLNDNITTNHGDITISAGTDVIAATNTKLVSNDGNISISAAGDVKAPMTAMSAGAGGVTVQAGGKIDLGYIKGNTLYAVSTGGDVNLNQPIGGNDSAHPEVGIVNIDAAGDVILNGINAAGQISSTQPGLSVVADGMITSNAKIVVNNGPIVIGANNRGTGFNLEDSIYSLNGYAIDIWPTVSLAVGPDLTACYGASNPSCIATVPSGDVPKIVVSNNDGYSMPNSAHGTQIITFHGVLNLSSDVLLKVVSFVDPNDITSEAMYSINYTNNDTGSQTTGDTFAFPVMQASSIDNYFNTTLSNDTRTNLYSDYTRTYENGDVPSSQSTSPVSAYIQFLAALNPSESSSGFDPSCASFSCDSGFSIDNALGQIYDSNQKSRITGEAGFPTSSIHYAWALYSGNLANNDFTTAADVNNAITGNVTGDPSLNPDLVGSYANTGSENTAVSFQPIGNTLAGLDSPSNITETPPLNLGVTPEPVTPEPVTPEPVTPEPVTPVTGSPEGEPSVASGDTPQSNNSDSSQFQNQLASLSGEKSLTQDETPAQNTLRLGGSGPASEADLGQSGSTSGAATDVFAYNYCLVVPEGSLMANQGFFSGCK